jgi:hypothetical protein
VQAGIHRHRRFVLHVRQHVAQVMDAMIVYQA